MEVGNYPKWKETNVGDIYTHFPSNHDYGWNGNSNIPLLFLPIYFLVGGFNPSQKYQSNWIISPSKGENNKCMKPPPGSSGCDPFSCFKWPFQGLLVTFIWVISLGHLEQAGT